jgi:hypothetical protein
MTAIVLAAILWVLFAIAIGVVLSAAQQRVFFAPYRAMHPFPNRRGMASRGLLSNVTLLVGLFAGSVSRARKDADSVRVLHEPLADSRMERRRKAAWLLGLAWVPAALLAGPPIFLDRLLGRRVTFANAD